MKVVNTTPPDWIMKGCMDKFRVNVDHTFWTYGDNIYNPGGGELPDHILAHEETHSRQQEFYGEKTREEMEQMLSEGKLERLEADNSEEYNTKNSGRAFMVLSDKKAYFQPEIGKDAWWREFLSNPRFRMEQEAEAYGAQYRFYCERVKDRNKRAMFLMQIANHFSGPLYQLALTQSQARQMIEVLSGQKQLTKTT